MNHTTKGCCEKCWGPIVSMGLCRNRNCPCHTTNEDTRGGTCPKCGAWKGGDYGMNAAAEQSQHVCATKADGWEQIESELRMFRCFAESSPTRFSEIEAREKFIVRCVEKIKYLHTSLLQKQREELAQKVEGLNQGNDDENTSYAFLKQGSAGQEGYRLALTDAAALIRNKEEGV